jgi:putative addiction module component (TIGR02574 family)
MKAKVNELAAQALSLPSEDRAQLAERLVESLEDETIEKLWIKEAKRRRDEIRSGRVKPISGDEALKQVRKLIAQ